MNVESRTTVAAKGIKKAARIFSKQQQLPRCDKKKLKTAYRNTESTTKATKEVEVTHEYSVSKNSYQGVIKNST